MDTKAKKQQDGRYRVSLSLTKNEIDEARSAAGNQPLSTWAKWALLTMARKVQESP